MQTELGLRSWGWALALWVARLGPAVAATAEAAEGQSAGEEAERAHDVRAPVCWADRMVSFVPAAEGWVPAGEEEAGHGRDPGRALQRGSAAEVAG
jgi:hypothetical protein